MKRYVHEVCKLMLGLALAAWAAACSPPASVAEAELDEEEAVALDAGQDDGGDAGDAGDAGDGGDDGGVGGDQCVTDADCGDPSAACTNGICDWAGCEGIDSGCTPPSLDSASAQVPTANANGVECAKGLGFMTAAAAGIFASAVALATTCAPTAGLGCAAGAAGMLASVIGYVINAETVFMHCPRCVACGVASMMQRIHTALTVSIAAAEAVYGRICGNPPPNQDCQEFRTVLNDLTAKNAQIGARLAQCPWWTKL